MPAAPLREHPQIAPIDSALSTPEHIRRPISAYLGATPSRSSPRRSDGPKEDMHCQVRSARLARTFFRLQIQRASDRALSFVEDQSQQPVAQYLQFQLGTVAYHLKRRERIRASKTKEQTTRS